MKGAMMKIFGYVLIVVGIAALMGAVWPVLLIGLGLIVVANSITARAWNKKVDTVMEKGASWKKQGVWLRLAWPSLHRAEPEEESKAEPAAEPAAEPEAGAKQDPAAPAS
jgi:hypothetical protein